MADRIVAGRVALARGERDVAAHLLSTLPPESVPPPGRAPGSADAARAAELAAPIRV